MFVSLHSSEARASTLLALPSPHGAKTFVSPGLPPACADTQGRQQGRIHRGAEPAPARSSALTSALTPDCLCWGVSDEDLCPGASSSTLGSCTSSKRAEGSSPYPKSHPGKHPGQQRDPPRPPPAPGPRAEQPRSEGKGKDPASSAAAAPVPGWHCFGPV